MTEPVESLHTKLLKAAKDAGYVQKAERNTAQSYNYAGDEAVTEKFRAAMLAQGILVYPSKIEFENILPMPRGEDKMPNILVHVRGEFTVTDGIESFTAQSLGSGMDVGDKATPKALTGFKKYAYRMLVMMVTGDDPEAARPDEKPRNDASTSAASRATGGGSGDAANGTQGGSVKPVAQKGDPIAATQAQKNKVRAEQHKIGLTDKQLGDLRKKVTGKLTSKDFTNADIDAMLDAMKDPVILAAVVSGGAVVEAEVAA